MLLQDCIGDGLDINGTFISFGEFKHINLKSNFMEYTSVRTPVMIRLHTLSEFTKHNTKWTIIPNYILLYINTFKSCKPM